MILTNEEQKIIEGEFGVTKQKAMELIVALGKIYRADKLIPVNSVQVAGVSYNNLGDAGLEFLREFGKDGKSSTTATLNPAGMDLENWKELGISEEFAKKQLQVIDAYKNLGIIPTCSCTPYLYGNLPKFKEHIAWSESSAVTFANSVIGAKTNREGGPSALAAAIVGKTANYGLHINENRKPDITINIETELKTQSDYGVIGEIIGKNFPNKIPYIIGINQSDVDLLKSLSASSVTYGAKPIFHIENITPEKVEKPSEIFSIGFNEITESYARINDEIDEIDFVFIGCPHASITEIKKVAKLVENKKVTKETWIATSRYMKKMADEAGYTQKIKDAGIKFACDTCFAVAPLKGRFNAVATTSAKGCFYARGKNEIKTKLMSLEKCIEVALNGN